MTQKKVGSILLQVKNAERRYRDGAVEQIIGEPGLLPYLVAFVSHPDDFLSERACWSLELICVDHANLLYPFSGELIGQLVKINTDRKRRPMAKVCALLSGHLNNPGQDPCPCSEEAVKDLVSWSFDQLIEERRVAIKVFAMQTIYNLMDVEPWIKEALRTTLQNNMNRESAAYRARAKKILAEIS